MSVKLGVRCGRCGDGQMRPHLSKVGWRTGFLSVVVHHVYCDKCDRIQHAGFEGMLAQEVHEILAKELGVKEGAISESRTYAGVCPDHSHEDPVMINFTSDPNRARKYCPICLRHLND
jgi:hypothetical protein